MPSKVYFVERRASSPNESLTARLEMLFNKAALGEAVCKDDLVAVKLHFGERGLTSYINPVFVRIIVDELKGLGVKPFLTDTNTLYRNARHNAVDHVETALLHGFSYTTAGAPVIIADGLRGHGSRDVPVPGKHFQQVKIAQAILDADSMIVMTHVKGHIITALGGAIKNLSMGCSSRAGKHMMHAAIRPKVIKEKCRGDKLCLHHCPVECIQIVDQVAVINEEQCIGCGECIVACPHTAIKIGWLDDAIMLQERMAEFAYGAVKDKKGRCAYINFLLDITPHCDCHGWSDSSIVPDIGILASFDPVAIDQASIDLINAQTGLAGSGLKKNFAPGEDKFTGVFGEVDYTAQLRHAAQMGLGSRDYELIKIE